MEQNGKAEPRRAVTSLTPPTPAGSDEWGQRLAVLDQRLTEAREAVERLAVCIAELAAMRPGLGPAPVTPEEPRGPEATGRADEPVAAAAEGAAPDLVAGPDDEAVPAEPLTQEEIRRLVEEIRSEQAGAPANIPAESAVAEGPPLEPADAVRAVEERLRRLASATVRVTVEDKRNGVPLVPLHRALLAVRAVEDVSLVSYAGGKAVVSVRVTGELDGKALERAVARALGRHCEVAFQDPTNLFIHVSEE